MGNMSGMFSFAFWLNRALKCTYFIDDYIQGVIKNPKIKEIQQVQQQI